MTGIKNDNVAGLMSSLLEPMIKETVNKIFEKEKAKALKELEVAFECVKSDMLAACAVEIQQRLCVNSTDAEFVIRVRR